MKLNLHNQKTSLNLNSYKAHSLLKIFLPKLFLSLAMILLFNTAQSKSMKVYKHVDENGIIHYSSKKPKARNVQILRIKCPECKWKNKVDWHNTPLYKDRYTELINKSAKKWNLPKELIRAVIHAESSFIADNVSSAGAQGLMQLMPETQKTYAVTQPFNPEENINGGCAYLSHLLVKYKNNKKLALAAYNAGETAVAKYGNDVPPYEETQNYIKRVNILMKRYKALN